MEILINFIQVNITGNSFQFNCINDLLCDFNGQEAVPQNHVNHDSGGGDSGGSGGSDDDNKHKNALYGIIVFLCMILSVSLCLNILACIYYKKIINEKIDAKHNKKQIDLMEYPYQKMNDDM